MHTGLRTPFLLLPLLFTACAVAQDAPQKPWETWQPPAVALPTPNAYDTYVKAFELKRQVDQEEGLLTPPPVAGGPPGAAPVPPPPPPAPPPPEGDEWGEGRSDLPMPQRLAPYRPVLALVREGLAQECRFPPVLSLNQPLPYLGQIRAIARLLAIEAEVCRLEGKFAAAADSGLTTIALARDCEQGTAIGHLVALACDAIAVRSLERTIPLLSAADCRRVLADLQALRRQGPTPEAWLTGEESFARLGLRELSRDPELLMRLTDTDEGLTEERCRQLVTDDLPQAWGEVGPQFARLRAALALPYPQGLALLTRPQSRLLALTTPNWRRLLLSNDVGRLHLDLCEVELAAQAYLLEPNPLLRSAEDLCPKYLEQLPPDTFADAPLRSVLADQTLTVYSVGPDGADDGGHPISERSPGPDSRGDICVKISLR